MDTSAPEPRRVEYVRLDDVQHAPRNPKLHDGPAITRAIEHHGFGELPLRDERTGRLVAGHGRHEQLVAMHSGGQSAPDGIVVDGDGMWRMPVVAGWASRSDSDAEAYVVGSNQITALGGWDDPELLAMLTDLNAGGLLDLAGFDAAAYADLLDAAGSENPFTGRGGGRRRRRRRRTTHRPGHPARRRLAARPAPPRLRGLHRPHGLGQPDAW
jgi:hypothetical protein